MLVSKILERKGHEVVTATPGESVAALAQLFKAERIGAAVVVGERGEIYGVVSERDIVHQLADFGGAALAKTAAEVMCAPVPSCTPDDNLNHVMGEMTRRRVRHLPVIADGRLCGIVSIGDVVKHRLEEIALEVNVLRDVARLRAVV